MHTSAWNIELKDISKIEGHAALDVKILDNKVQDVKFKIFENKRFFTEAARGKSYLSVHQIVSRICGTCSTAHLMCCIKCVENAHDITPSKQTEVLRDLTLYGLNLRDHAMHLYLFCLPDIFNKDSLLEFADEGYEHELVHRAFEVKGAGNNLSKLVAGRAVHPPFPVVGGYAKVPEPSEIKNIVRELKVVRDAAIEFVEIFYKSGFNLGIDTCYIGLLNSDFSYGRGHMEASDGYCIEKRDFPIHLEKTVLPYSQASAFQYRGRPYLVGALSRLNINHEALHENTRRDLKKYLSVFPSNNIYHNNLAQAIEIVHCIDASIELLESMEFKKEEHVRVPPKVCEGTGVIEAPRGTLYYNMRFDGQGKVTYANLVIPTAQNQLMIERCIGQLVEQKLAEGMKKKQLELEIEKLIRAFDPCMSCATHFLKVNWI